MVMIHLLRCLIALLVLGGCAFGLVRADDDTPKLKLSAEEQKILDLTNKEREKANLPPLKPNPMLFEAARAHSANMARKGEMTHELDGKNPAQRVQATGYEYSWVGENIASGVNWSLDSVVQGWMNSKPHRDNILNDKFEEIGLGVARGDNGQVYFTQVFGKPRK
jgi:uncharacterized protein YkwD